MHCLAERWPNVSVEIAPFQKPSKYAAKNSNTYFMPQQSLFHRGSLLLELLGGVLENTLILSVSSFISSISAKVQYLCPVFDYYLFGISPNIISERNEGFLSTSHLTRS